MVNHDNNKDIGKILRQQRIMMGLTICGLSATSGVSSSHLSRVEKGGRFPSAAVLRRIAGPLDFDDRELMALAGYLSAQPAGTGESGSGYREGQLDPYVAAMLGQEPVEVQRAVIGVLSILRCIADGNKGQEDKGK